jgi:hypothetical protein
VLDAYRGDAPADDASGIHLADLERLGLALEAFSTVFPGYVAPLAREFSDAVRALAHIGVTEPPPEERPGDLYITARNKITDVARRMIAPSWRTGSGACRVHAAWTCRPRDAGSPRRSR